MYRIDDDAWDLVSSVGATATAAAAWRALAGREPAPLIRFAEPLLKAYVSAIRREPICR